MGYYSRLDAQMQEEEMQLRGDDGYHQWLQSLDNEARRQQDEEAGQEPMRMYEALDAEGIRALEAQHAREEG